MTTERLVEFHQTLRTGPSLPLVARKVQVRTSAVTVLEEGRDDQRTTMIRVDGRSYLVQGAIAEVNERLWGVNERLWGA